MFLLLLCSSLTFLWQFTRFVKNVLLIGHWNIQQLVTKLFNDAKWPMSYSELPVKLSFCTYTSEAVLFWIFTLLCLSITYKLWSKKLNKWWHFCCCQSKLFYQQPTTLKNSDKQNWVKICQSQLTNVTFYACWSGLVFSELSTWMTAAKTVTIDWAVVIINYYWQSQLYLLTAKIFLQHFLAFKNQWWILANTIAIFFRKFSLQLGISGRFRDSETAHLLPQT